jgi:hypothetical protein
VFHTLTIYQLRRSNGFQFTINLTNYESLSQSVSQSIINQSINQSTYLPIYIFNYLRNCLPVYPTNHAPTQPPCYLPTYPSIHPSPYPLQLPVWTAENPGAKLHRGPGLYNTRRKTAQFRHTSKKPSALGADKTFWVQALVKVFKMCHGFCLKALRIRTAFSKPYLSSMRRASIFPYCHLRPLWLHHIFRHYHINGTIFGKKLLNIKCVFWFSL